MSSKDKYSKSTDTNTNKGPFRMSREPIFPDGSETDDSGRGYGFFNICNQISVNSDTSDDMCFGPTSTSKSEDMSSHELISQLQSTALQNAQKESSSTISSFEFQPKSHSRIDYVNSPIRIEINTPEKDNNPNPINILPEMQQEISNGHSLISSLSNTNEQSKYFLPSPKSLSPRSLTPVSVLSDISSRSFRSQWKMNSPLSIKPITPGTLTPVSMRSNSSRSYSPNSIFALDDGQENVSPHFNLNRWKVLPPIKSKSPDRQWSHGERSHSERSHSERSHGERSHGEQKLAINSTPLDLTCNTKQEHKMGKGQNFLNVPDIKPRPLFGTKPTITKLDIRGQCPPGESTLTSPYIRKPQPPTQRRKISNCRQRRFSQRLMNQRLKMGANGSSERTTGMDSLSNPKKCRSKMSPKSNNSSPRSSTSRSKSDKSTRSLTPSSKG